MPDARLQKCREAYREPEGPKIVTSLRFHRDAFALVWPTPPIDRIYIDPMIKQSADRFDEAQRVAVETVACQSPDPRVD